MSTLFTKIINEEIPSYKIYEDEHTYVFLTIQPLYEGHTLVVPKAEVDKWYDNENTTLYRLMDTAKLVSTHLEKIFDAERVAMIIEGLEVPHTHLHLVPLPTGKGLQDATKTSPAESTLQLVHQKIIDSGLL